MTPASQPNSQSLAADAHRLWHANEPLSGSPRHTTWARYMGAVADEASLIARIASGDAIALRVLFARHHVRVYRFIRRLVRDGAIAEELTNEVFLEIWRHAKGFEGTASAL